VGRCPSRPRAGRALNLHAFSVARPTRRCGDPCGHCRGLCNLATLVIAKLPLPDEHPNTVNALRNKRAEIAGKIELRNREVERLRAALIHIDAVLRLFDPGTDPNDIEPRKRFPRRIEYFEKGELARRVYEALRTDGDTVSSEELTRKALADKGLASTDRVAHRLFMCKFMPALADLRRRGVIVKIGEGHGVRWKLAPVEPGLI
jgi:hypothetical protein